MPGARTIDDFRASLAPDQRALVDCLRALAASVPGVVEQIKWNAPSFSRLGRDRITLGLCHNGAVRVVLHRGARAVTEQGFSFAAPGDLVQWAAPDRGVMHFSSVAQVEARTEEIADLFRRWMEID